MNIQRHSNQSIWNKYIFPKRLTFKSNPPIYRWLFWVFSF